jgi:heme/copper-type cytochrome/quinol oxidase subunit 2
LLGWFRVITVVVVVVVVVTVTVTVTCVCVCGRERERERERESLCVHVLGVHVWKLEELIIAVCVLSGYPWVSRTNWKKQRLFFPLRQGVLELTL